MLSVCCIRGPISAAFISETEHGGLKIPEPPRLIVYRSLLLPAEQAA